MHPYNGSALLSDCLLQKWSSVIEAKGWLCCVISLYLHYLLVEKMCNAGRVPQPSNNLSKLCILFTVTAFKYNRSTKLPGVSAWDLLFLACSCAQPSWIPSPSSCQATHAPGARESTRPPMVCTLSTFGRLTGLLVGS